MIKNQLALTIVGAAVLALSSCAKARADEPAGFQGVVEFDQSLIGFEVAGRLDRVLVKEGDLVKSGDKLALLDDAMTRSSRDARAREADAAQSQVDLVEAGTRPEEIASMAARV